jgi:bifunctional UDP-N-acetylglucosamine pyrophosphorylase/glucosamine-1-phosphate N-acetyltransferase
MADSIGVIILAAGKGTRMKVPTPKALMPALGKSLLDYVIEEGFLFAKAAGLPCEVGVVVGHLKELLISHLQEKFPNSPLKTAIQKEQNGTADALKACFIDHPHFWDHTYTLVACADTPLIQEADFSKLFLTLKSNPNLVGVAASFHLDKPTGYGRIIRSGSGFHIVEEKDATDAERKVTEVNSGFYILKTSHVKEVLNKISNNNKSGEFYLTDMFQDNYAVESICFENGTPFLGVNTMEQLAEVTSELKGRHQQKLMVNGVRFLMPELI